MSDLDGTRAAKLDRRFGLTLQYGYTIALLKGGELSVELTNQIRASIAIDVHSV